MKRKLTNEENSLSFLIYEICFEINTKTLVYPWQLEYFQWK